MSETRFEGIDLLKGILIILVIIGHVQTLRLDQDVVRYAIYSFHMPLFLALSGFLINKERFEKLNIIAFFRKYFLRIMIPWIVGFVVYFIYYYKYHMIPKGITISKDLVLHEMLYPRYHLWYLTSLFFMIFILWIILKIKLPPWIIIPLGVAFTMIWLSKYTFDPKNASPKFFIDTYFLGNKKTFYYFVFFYLGYYARNYKRKILSKWFWIVIVFALSVLRIYDFYYMDNIYLTNANFILLNISLIFLSSDYIAGKSFKSSIGEKLKEIGRLSMPIYLWHEIVILLLKYYMYNKINLYLYYGVVGIISVFDFIPLVIILSRNRFINKYLFFNR